MLWPTRGRTKKEWVRSGMREGGGESGEADGCVGEEYDVLVPDTLKE